MKCGNCSSPRGTHNAIDLMCRSDDGVAWQLGSYFTPNKVRCSNCVDGHTFEGEFSEKCWLCNGKGFNTGDKPVLYLDVDGVFFIYPKMDMAVPAPGLLEFLRWGAAHCELRWLTAWTLRGKLDREAALAMISAGLTPELIAPINNPMGWRDLKSEAIDWAEHEAGRPWVWLDDDHMKDEIEVLKQHDAYDNLININVIEQPHDLYKAWYWIGNRFQLPLPVEVYKFRTV